MVPFEYPCCTDRNIWRYHFLYNSRYLSLEKSSAYTADSFQIPSLTTWNLTSAEFVGITENTVPAGSWRFVIYESATFADDPQYLIPKLANPITQLFYNLPNISGFGSLTLNLPSIKLTAGTYWVTFYPYITTTPTDGIWYQRFVCPWENITSPPELPPLANAPPAAIFHNIPVNTARLTLQYVYLIYLDLISSGIVFFHSQRLPPQLFSITLASREVHSKWNSGLLELRTLQLHLQQPSCQRHLRPRTLLHW